MKTWFQVQIKHSKEQPDGMVRQVNEAFLFDSVNYAEAESRAYKWAEENCFGDFSVAKVTKSNISEIIQDEEHPADDWWKCKVVYSTVDGDSGKEVSINSYFLVAGTDIRDVLRNLDEFLRSMLVPWTLPSCTLTQIQEVIPFQAKTETQGS